MTVGPRNLLPVAIGSGVAAGGASTDIVYLDDDGTQWVKTGPDRRDWRRVGPRPPPPAPWPPPGGEAAMSRTWPQALVARFRALGHKDDQALDLAEDRLRRLRRGDPPRDVLGSAPFSAGLGIPEPRAQTLDRMFNETNFADVESEWAWKNLFEAGVDGLPPPT